MNKILLILIPCLWGGLFVNAQKKPEILNAWFEQSPAMDAKVPAWEWCSQTATPDILPGVWNVQTPAYQGNTYLGLICRADKTYEAIYQKLGLPLQAKACYKLKVALAVSAAYSGYHRPARMRIWGGNSPCERAQLLISSPTIEHTDWKQYEFFCVPEQNWKYIILECFYKEPCLLPYRGNILIDALEGFFACDRA